MPIGTLANNESGSSCRAKLNQGLSLWDGMVGAVIAFAGASAPSKWLICNGAAVSRTTYSSLFSIVGETYGAGDSSTTFNLPDLRGRVIAGLDEDATGRLTNQSVSPDEATLGANGGVEALSGTDVSSGSGVGAASSLINVQPTIILNYIIYTGV